MEDEVITQQEQPQEQAQQAQQQDAQQVEQQQEPKQEPPEWVMRRMAEITAKRRAAEEEAARWREMYERSQTAAPVAGDPAQVPPQNVDQLARAYAENMRAQERERERLAQIESAGRKEFGADFDSAVANLNAAGVGGPEFLKVIAEIPDAQKVVAWLGKHDNLGEAIRISGLNPIQMGIELTKLAGKASKDLTKQVSKAPPPVQHIEGGSSASDQVEPAVGSKEWFDWRNKNARKRR
jgi:hypothetical protein